MYFTIYRTTNKLNSKIYIGKHQTSDLDDGYMGSGKHLKRAMTKYGIEQFTKEILHVFESEEEMNVKERELVTEEFCARKDTYNICEGGKGGFGYINRNGINNKKDFSIVGPAISRGVTGLKRPGNGKNFDGYHNSGKARYDTFLGRKHSEETKQKIGEKNRSLTGNKNGSFGTYWITNGNENKKIKNSIIPDGWTKGRCLKLTP